MNGISYGDLAALAENAYVYLDKLEDVGGDYRIADDLELATTINKEDDRFDGKFTPEQAADFVANWSVVDHRPNTDAGFSSTLFKNAAGEYVLAFRGTEQFIDDFLVSDIGDIARDGLAIAQIIDMYNEYQRLSSPAGTAYDMAKLRLLEDETQAYEQALFEAQDPYGTGEGVDALDFLRARGDIIVDSGKVYAVDLVTSTDIYPEGDEWRLASGALHGQTLAAVTGHSLGGHLAMAFSRLFGVEALAINGAGFGFTQNPASMADTTVNNLLALLDGADSFDSKMILNIYGDKGWEFVAQHGPVLFQPGGYEPAFIETTPFLTYGHGKEQMTDALAVFDLFVRLVPGLNALAPDAVLARFNRLLEASSDKAASSFDAIVGTLSDLLITDGSLDSVDADNTRALSYAHLIAVKNKIESLPVVDRQLIDIQDYSSADALAEAATSDVALRYALLNLDPFAISGDDALYVQHNSAGELNLYDSSIGEGLTGQYLKDRAKFVKTLSDWADADGLPSLSMDGGLWHFEDVAGDIEVYNALYSTDPSVERVQYFRFGTDLANEPDALVGGGQADFLYGGDGADYLEGKAGADYLEGGKGDDIYGHLYK